MDAERTRTGRLPRLLSRTLIVLGGAVAATATAWLISSATASADTGPADITLPLGQPAPAAEAALRPVTNLVTHPALSALAPVSTPPQAIPADLRSTLRTAVLGIGGHTPAVPLAGPAKPTAPATAPMAPMPTGGASTAHRAVAAEPATGHPANEVGRSGNHSTPAPATVRPAPQRTALPGPLSSPITVPVAPGGSTGGAGGQQGPTGLGFADQAAGPATPGLGLGGACPDREPSHRPTVGRQPGNTPD